MSIDQVEQTKQLFAKELSSVTTKVEGLPFFLSTSGTNCSFTSVYPGAAHGFTIRPDLNNDAEKKQQVSVLFFLCKAEC